MEFSCCPSSASKWMLLRLCVLSETHLLTVPCADEVHSLKIACHQCSARHYRERASVLECGRADARRKPASKLPLSPGKESTSAPAHSPPREKERAAILPSPFLPFLPFRPLCPLCPLCPSDATQYFHRPLHSRSPDEAMPPTLCENELVPGQLGAGSFAHPRCSCPCYLAPYLSCPSSFLWVLLTRI